MLFRSREDDHVDKGDRDGSEADLRAPAQCGNAWGVASLQEPENVLENDDAIVYQNADRQRERKGREEVEGKTLQVHERERRDKRGWNCEQDNEGAAPRVQEPEKHDAGEYICLKERALNTIQ